MTTKTATTKSGKTIKVEITRRVQDKTNYSDGFGIVTGREIVDITEITLLDGNKVLTTGHSVKLLNQKYDSKMIAAGAFARVGDAYLTKENYDLLVSLIAEVEAETPKSEEQIEIEREQEQRKADQEAALEAEYSEQKERESHPGYCKKCGSYCYGDCGAN